MNTFSFFSVPVSACRYPLIRTISKALGANFHFSSIVYKVYFTQNAAREQPHMTIWLKLFLGPVPAALQALLVLCCEKPSWGSQTSTQIHTQCLQIIPGQLLHCDMSPVSRGSWGCRQAEGLSQLPGEQGDGDSVPTPHSTSCVSLAWHSQERQGTCSAWRENMLRKIIENEATFKSNQVTPWD